jgi:integrase/recombinase XerD
MPERFANTAASAVRSCAMISVGPRTKLTACSSTMTWIIGRGRFIHYKSAMDESFRCCTRTRQPCQSAEGNNDRQPQVNKEQLDKILTGAVGTRGTSRKSPTEINFVRGETAMTTLLQRMQDDMTIRNLAPNTRASYIHHISMFTRRLEKSPETVVPDEIRSYQLYLSTERKAAPATVAIAVSALRFFYSVTLQRNWVMEEAIPLPKRPETLPPVLSADEVLRFLECVRHANHRTILMTCYAAGLRISEVVRLKPGEVDSRRMVIRIEEGKGRRDRYVMLSPRLLETLEKWRALGKPKLWLFPGNRSENPITRHAVEKHVERLIGFPEFPNRLRRIL